MTATCHQVVFTAPGVAALLERQLPPLQPLEVRIRTAVSLISPGTERAFFLGLPNTTQVYPQFSGYNNIGEVIEVGEQVEGLLVGTRVASPCHHASLVQPLGSEVFHVPAGIGDEAASFFNLVSIALQGVRKARIEIGEHAVVIGAGLIGLLAAQLSQVNGALPVTILDRDISRLGFARAVGIDSLPLPEDQNVDSLSTALSQDAAPAVVIEATGHPDAVKTALALAAPGGRVVLLGSTRGITPEVNFYRDVHKKGLTLIGAHDIARPHYESHAGYWTQADDRKVALRLLAAGRLNVESFITHRLQWIDSVKAYDMLRNWDASALGIVLNWRNN